MNNTTPSQLVICTLPKTQPRYYRICFQQTVLVNFLKKWFILAIAKIKEKKYIFAFTCQRFSCCKKIQPSDVAVMSFTLGKLLHSARYKLGEICWKSPGQSSKKGFHRSLKTFVCSAVFPIIDTAPLFCFVEACVDATEHNQECQTYKLMIRHNLTIYALSGKLFRG